MDVSVGTPTANLDPYTPPTNPEEDLPRLVRGNNEPPSSFFLPFSYRPGRECSLSNRSRQDSSCRKETHDVIPFPSDEVTPSPSLVPGPVSVPDSRVVVGRGTGFRGVVYSCVV